MRRFTLIEFEYNEWNYFNIGIIGMEVKNFEGSLLGFYFGPRFLHIDIMFIRFKIESPFY